MNKLLTKLSIAVAGMAMAIGVGVGLANNNGYAKAEAATATLSYGGNSNTDAATSQTAKKLTTDLGLSASLFEVSYSKGTSGSDTALRTDGIRMYATKNKVGNVLTIAALNDATINSIEIHYDSVDYSTYAVVKANNVVKSTTVDAETFIGTYSINYSSFSITNDNTGTNSNMQVRFQSIVIEYTAGGPATQASSISLSPSSLTIEYGFSGSFTPTLVGGSGAYQTTINWVSNNTDVIANPGQVTAGQEITITPNSVLESTQVTLTGTVIEPGSATNTIVVTVTPPRAIHHYSLTGKPFAYTSGSWDLLDVKLHAWYDSEETEEKTIVKGNDYSLSTVTSVPASATREVSVTVSYTCGNDNGSIAINGEVYTKRVDTLTASTTNTQTSGYSSWSDKTFNSSAVYAGTTNYDKTKNAINMNSSTNDVKRGIFTTASGGFVKKISIAWGSDNTAGRSLLIYGKNSAYTAASELTDEQARGTQIGSLVTGSATTVVNISGDYAFVAFYASAAFAVSSIEVTWGERQSLSVHHIVASAPSGTWYVGESPTLNNMGVSVLAYYAAGNEGNSDDVTANCSITSGLPLANVGANELTIQYGETDKTTTISVTALSAVTMTKVTSITNLIVGDTIYLAKADGTYVMGAGSYSGVEGSPASMRAKFDSVLVGADSNGYFLRRSDNVYIANNSSSNSGGAINTAESLDTTNLTTYWDISFDNDGNAIIVSKFFSDRSLRINTTSKAFSTYYNNGQGDICIYARTASPTAQQKVNTFCALYMHTEIIDNETTRASDTETCFDYFDAARATLDPESGAWSSIAEAFSQSAYWERYVKWGKARGVEVTYSDGIHYSGRTAFAIDNLSKESNNTLIAIIIIASVSALAVGGYFFIRRKHQ